MALKKIDGQELVLSNANGAAPGVKTPKNILDEDRYTECIEKIVERDFYPDLPQLQAQAEFLEAKEKNDVVTLRRLNIKYGPKQRGAVASVYDTPASFETPEPKPCPSPESNKNNESEWETMSTTTETHDTHIKKAGDGYPSLDKFLSQNTSEDNASFDDILQESENRERTKNAWLYDAEVQHKQKYEQQVVLPSIEEQAAITNESSSVDNWTYNTRNSLMYIPLGVDKSPKDAFAEKKKARKIIHTNTRFIAKPFAERVNRNKLQEATAVQNMLQSGKIGPDGKQIVRMPTPRVNGYGFMATPSPAPGVSESPLMTWGEIEGTPFRLDAGDIAVGRTPGPTFKIPAIPARDQIGMELAEHASKAHRAKKQEALKRINANFATPSPTFGKSSADIINSLSPAARLLATSKLGIRTHTDKALRASYTPSPGHRTRQTPPTTPQSTTPQSTTPASKRSLRTPKSPRTPKLNPARTPETSLTDNLLNLPKRARADDFF